MISKGSKTDIAISQYYQLMLNGCLLCIDPSVGSNSSMPGWAVYQAGELVESGCIEIEVVRELPPRLQTLSRSMYQLIQRWNPDVLVYENIPAQRHGGGNAEAHASLLKALGVILSIPGPDFYVPLLPVTWKRFVRADYVKTDERDAIELGYVSLLLARHYAEKASIISGRPRKSSKSKTPKKLAG